MSQICSEAFSEHTPPGPIRSLALLPCFQTCQAVIGRCHFLPGCDWLMAAGSSRFSLGRGESGGDRMLWSRSVLFSPGSVLSLLPLVLLGFGWPGSEARDSDLSSVTCGSLVKLLNTRHNVRLHSHDVKYGSGSGQQSVTGVDAADDANSYWQIRGRPGHPCARGTPVRCGQQVRFTHMKTGRNLHSHHFSSPLSNNQEVSAFGERGEGDDLDVWAVLCDGEHWERDDSVRIRHVGTDVFLSVTGETYGHPIRGQREVHGMTAPGPHALWRTMEGVFIQPSTEPMRHDEL